MEHSYQIHLGLPSYYRNLHNRITEVILYLPCLQHRVFGVFDVWLFALTSVYNVKFIRTSKQMKIS